MRKALDEVIKGVKIREDRLKGRVKIVKRQMGSDSHLPMDNEKTIGQVDN